MRPSRTPAVALAAALTLTAAGCGSGGGDSAKAPSKATDVARADAICRTANTRITTAAKQTFTAAVPTLPQIRRYASTAFFPVVERELRDLRALTPPAGDDGAAEAIYDCDRARPDSGARESGAARTAREAQPFTAANAQARRYGLTVCGAS
ncbi:hypothetical protein NBH00_03375 [Paraconexibacter antarcticus]|uniref:Lipoprotein n=1 Tax=Paraconexibacter antarcticus TaxID=2949664 RepID=A0ABY5DXH3_9ACTN|nr:hypothetical protein [Paraconexibacter antarcticus]UTI65259.1 hypothetical protein NBH00_03375 [Paraconexibacter antarcticus]